MISLSPALLASATSALCLHGLVLGSLVWADGVGDGSGGPGGRPASAVHAMPPPAPSHPALLVRWRAPMMQTASDAEADIHHDTPATRVTTSTPPVTEPLAAHLLRAEGPAPLPNEPAAINANNTISAIGAPDEADGLDDAGNPLLAYLPRSALDQGPEPLAPVVVPYPDGVQTRRGRLTLQLAVYIDENGHVRRTEPVGDRLEAAFERAANDAFLQARFRPGERQGQAVKTRLLIELAFEALPTDTARGMRLSAANGLPTPGP